MRASAVALTTALGFWLTGCGYVGPVLPPSPELPPAVTNLSVLEHGEELQISFTAPARTTDNLPIDQFSAIDLRIGPPPNPFDIENWAAAAAHINTPPPPEADDPHNPSAARVSRSLPVAEWVGKRVTVGVRTAVRRKGHFSSWSNFVTINVVVPLKAPVVQARASANGVQLSWSSSGSDVQYRVYRKGLNADATQVGTTKTSDYLDASAQFDTPYEYTVVAFEGLAESPSSRPASITPLDTFAPSVPASITALAGPNTVEVTWQRSPEPDLKGYYLFRSVDGGPFKRVESLLAVPAYTDRAVEHGKTYQYQVSAIDQKGNVSDKSVVAEARF